MRRCVCQGYNYPANRSPLLPVCLRQPQASNRAAPQKTSVSFSTLTQFSIPHLPGYLISHFFITQASVCLSILTSTPTHFGFFRCISSCQKLPSVGPTLHAALRSLGPVTAETATSLTPIDTVLVGTYSKRCFCMLY